MKHRNRNLLITWCGALLLCSAVPAFGVYGGPGLHSTTLYAGQTIDAGTVAVWNSPKKIMVQVETSGGWRIAEAHIYVGYPEIDPIPTTKKGNIKIGHLPYIKVFTDPVPKHTLTLDLQEDLGFSWGSQYYELREPTFLVHASLVQLDDFGEIIAEEGAWAYGEDLEANHWGWRFRYLLGHPRRGQFIDSPVQGLLFHGPTQKGSTGPDEDSENGGFLFFPAEHVEFLIGTMDDYGDFSEGAISLGSALADKKVSPLDLFPGAGIDWPEVIDIARILQTLDADAGVDGKISILPEVAGCFEEVAENYVNDLGQLDYGYADFNIEGLLADIVLYCDGAGGATLSVVSAAEAQANLEAGLNASGIFRKNVSKTEDFGETKQKLDVMPVYFPGVRSNGDPSLCIDVNGDGIYDEGEDTLGVPYEEWRLNGDPLAEECDPRIFEDPEACQVTLIECREIAKPIVTTYLEKIDIYDDQVTTNFWPGRFAWDVYTAVSRDDGTTWKRMNVSRMADLSSFDLETGEPFPGTAGSPYLKINDNYILAVWESKFCKSGNPRYAIDNCELYPDDCVDADGDGAVDDVCRGNADNGTLVCEEDYPFDDDYYVTDIWGVRGQQRSVNYDEVDDVAELGIGEIPYSCLWAARGVVVSQHELGEGTFGSLTDNPNLDCVGDGQPYACCTGLGTGTCEIETVGLGDIVWFKPERLTSGRRDVYIPMVGSARGAGFAIAWQEDPKGLRPGKGKGPGEGWSGAISNHKTDIWYSYISYEDFATVDANFVPGGPPESEGPDERPGLGRPKAQVPFSLPVRVSDNDMVNTNSLKVEQSSHCVTPPGGTEPVCFPEVLDGTFVPLDPEEIASQFCGHPDADPATCCDPEDHEGDPNCEDLKGLYGNMTGTKRFAYLARSIDILDNATGLATGGDGVPDYQYFVDNGGTLDLCDTSEANSYMEELPGTSAHERWYTFTNAAGASKLVCVSSDGRLLDGDVSASRPMLQLQPYTRPDGSKGAWALMAYEESKGMGHSLAAEEHDEDVGDDIVGRPDEPGQDKPIKQDLGKNLIYHSFDFAEPDLVSPGHIVNLPALCGGLYPSYCDDADNPTCTCELGQPVPLYFDYEQCSNPDDPATCEWMPDDTKLLQYRTEIARRARFIMQSPGKMGPSKTLGAIIFKQGQEGQGRPADVMIRRMVKSGTGNPYKFENFECTTYLDQTFTLPACPSGAGDRPSAVGYTCNVWGEAYGDRLCGGTFADPNGGFTRRDQVNLTSHDIDLAVDAGPEDDTPDDPTDDVYGTDKVLLWSQHEYNLGDESYGVADTSVCDLVSCAGMYSNARSHRGFIRGDFFVTAFSMSPNWAAGRNGNDRYNFYVRRSFDGGQTWTTDPAGAGVYVCPEFRTDPDSPDPDGSGNLPPELYDETCGTWEPVPDSELPPMPVGIAMTRYDDPLVTTTDGVQANFIGAGQFEPARNVSEIGNNHESSGDPRVGATPPTYPLDGRDATLPILRLVEDEYVNNIFFVAWGTVDNLKSTGSTGVKAEGSPLDLFYTRSENFGDTYLKVPWVIGGVNSNLGYGETVWRYEYLAKGEPEQQGECQLRATSDGSKAYAIFHSEIAAEEDEDEIPTRWYPWKPEESFENDLWFRRLIFWPVEEEPTP